MITTMVMMYNWIWENEYTPKRWREGVVVNLVKEETRLAQGIIEGKHY